MARDCYRTPPDQRPTTPAMQRVSPPSEAASRQAQDEIETKALCPLCTGCGWVSPVTEAKFSAICKQVKEEP